ncbi:MAG: isopentenyl phosphate kinase family protein [Methanospirillaceae archaeon]|nr:isopentenyl phosphate kinase family protein [Methanospirillaceae archaeon]
MDRRILLKIGGSVITDKSGSGEVRMDVLDSIAGTLAAYKKSLGHTPLHLLVVHGAGSYGHPEASRYRIQKGVTSANVAGIYHTHRAVSKLDEIMVSSLRSAGLEAVGIHPLHGSLAESGRLIQYPVSQIKLMMQVGVIPVLHGDVVMDCVKGACIVSGDQLVRVYARELQMERVGLATDVPGLLGADGQVIRRLHASQNGEIHAFSSNATDVTGGMRGKIDELLPLARDGIPSEIFHISRLSAFLAGTDHGGTCISLGV